MFKVLRNLSKSWMSVVVIILLLIVQATADLNLPDYTSKIVNIGIQQGGIENASPDYIAKIQLDNLLKFTNEDEKIFINWFSSCCCIGFSNRLWQKGRNKC